MRSRIGPRLLYFLPNLEKNPFFSYASAEAPSGAYPSPVTVAGSRVRQHRNNFSPSSVFRPRDRSERPRASICTKVIYFLGETHETAIFLSKPR